MCRTAGLGDPRIQCGPGDAPSRSSCAASRAQSRQFGLGGRQGRGALAPAAYLPGQLPIMPVSRGAATTLVPLVERKPRASGTQGVAARSGANTTRRGASVRMMPPPNAPGRPGGSRRFARHSEDASIPATATPTNQLLAGGRRHYRPTVTSNSTTPSDLSSLRICTERGGRRTL